MRKERASYVTPPPQVDQPLSPIEALPVADSMPQYQGRPLSCAEMRVLDAMRCLERLKKPFTLVVHYNGRTTHVMEGVVRSTTVVTQQRET